MTVWHSEDAMSVAWLTVLALTRCCVESEPTDWTRVWRRWCYAVYSRQVWWCHLWWEAWTTLATTQIHTRQVTLPVFYCWNCCELL